MNLGLDRPRSIQVAEDPPPFWDESLDHYYGGTRVPRPQEVEVTAIPGVAVVSPSQFALPLEPAPGEPMPPSPTVRPFDEVYDQHESPTGHDLPRFVGYEEWQSAKLKPLPGVVGEVLPALSGGECLQLAQGHELVGLHCGDGETWLWGVPGHALYQWSLSADTLALSVYAGDPIGFQEWGRPREMIGAMLPRIMGASGRRLALAPVIEQDLGGDWLLFTPDPDHRIGWEGETRVGDTWWGNCRIYVHPSILHIVFDLPDEDEG
ncbi:MAG: hypothetical protein GF320_03580 [Armatimonadia bacterium]|nr:hypothetical protein [Armatimonadia bacterium]